jgi:hypothetical protein
MGRNAVTINHTPLSYSTHVGKMYRSGMRIEIFGKPKNIEVGTELGRKATFNITVEGI